MTKAIEKAFAKLAKLSDEQQDAIAEWIIQELESEQRWTILFDQSQDFLESLADEALNEFHKDKTHNLDMDNHE